MARLQPGITLCFLASGAAGLLYQIAWMRYMALFIGQTSLAVVLVLMAFLGGLALGNALLGACADRVRHPLRFYAWLELAIGLLGLAFPSLYQAVRLGFETAAQGLDPGSPQLALLRFTAAAGCVLIPTTLMGATLPALARFLTRTLHELTDRVAWLYFINSAGAVGGCALAEFWAIPALGLAGTVRGAGLLNLAVAAAAFLIARPPARTQPDPPAPGPLNPSAPDAAPLATGPAETISAPPDLALRLCLFGSFISGFVALLYEIAWTRILALSLGSTHQAFALMLMAFIAGIALGSAWLQRRRQVADPTRAFGWAELALAATVLFSMFSYERIGFAVARMAGWLERTPETFVLYQWLQATVCLALMLPPTFCLGLTLPLASRAATRSLLQTGRSVGRVFALNTLGTVAGAALTGLVLLPQAGLAATLALGVALNTLLGIALVRHHAGGLPRAQWPGAAIVAALFVAGCALWFGPRWATALGFALWRYETAPARWEEFLASAAQYRTLYHADGASATVNVAEFESRGRKHLALRINGKVDASTLVDVPTQLLCGHLPMLLHPRPARVLVVGLGSGMTAGALTCHAELAQADVLEISPEVAAAARLFAPYNRQALDHPKVRLVLEDAKTFLTLQRQPYDVIISEPSHPWLAGMAGLFSVEFYAQCRSRLAPGGLMLQWIHFYESDNATLDILLATFTHVFPHTALWRASERDLLLVGATATAPGNLELLASRFRQPDVLADLRRIAIDRLPTLLALEILPAPGVAGLPAALTPLHRDDDPVLERVAQRALFVRRRADAWRALDERAIARPGTLFGRWIEAHPLDADDCEALVLAGVEQGLLEPAFLRGAVRRWRSLAPQALLPVETELWLRDPPDAAEARLADLRAAESIVLAAEVRDIPVLRRHASAAFEAYRSMRSAFYLPDQGLARRAAERLIELDPPHSRVQRLHLAELAWDRGDDAAFSQLAAAALHPDPRQAGNADVSADPFAPHEVLWRLIENARRAGLDEQARGWARQAIESGYARTLSSPRHPRLELLVRQVDPPATSDSP